jgi:hypothetical protein
MVDTRTAQYKPVIGATRPRVFSVVQISVEHEEHAWCPRTRLLPSKTAIEQRRELKCATRPQISPLEADDIGAAWPQQLARE